MSEPENITTAPNKRQRQGRSPAYPTLPIDKAIEQARVLYDRERKNFAPLASAFTAWGYGAKSSGGRQTLATLRYFGLIEVEGGGDSRQVKVSEMALRVILDEREDSNERDSLIREMALTPSVHKEMYQKYPDGLPSDATVKHYLTFEREFNPSAAEELLDEFKRTADYASLYKPDIVSDKVKDDDDYKGDQKPVIGDFVQWELNGTFQLEAPRRVRAVQSHDDKKWVFVEGSETGIPMDQVIVETKDQPLGGGAPILPIEDDKLKEGWHEERLLDDDGNEIIIRYEGKPSVGRYEFIRDYLSFKLDRLKPKKEEPAK
ncbi:MAG: hypothetical protein IIA72_23625 [Proteobacteria bacterium]|nr:hypothetical protein [Pseudomonadota bacterium]